MAGLALNRLDEASRRIDALIESNLRHLALPGESREDTIRRLKLDQRKGGER